MITAESLNALADRVEREEPSRELDYLIFIATNPGWIDTRKPSKRGRLQGQMVAYRAVPNSAMSVENMPAYTTSQDSAVTLVPEGCGWVLNNPVDLAGRPSAGISGFVFDAFAATPAAALTAAALRARAADMQARFAPHPSRTA